AEVGHPAYAGSEEDRGECGCVAHRRPDVRLHEYEEDRNAREPDRLHHRARVVELPRAFSEKAREGDDEEHLPELRRLEAEEAEVEPSLRPADRALREDDRDRKHGAAEDETPATRIPRGVDQECEEE